MVGIVMLSATSLPFEVAVTTWMRARKRLEVKRHEDEMAAKLVRK